MQNNDKRVSISIRPFAIYIGVHFLLWYLFYRRKYLFKLQCWIIFPIIPCGKRNIGEMTAKEARDLNEMDKEARDLNEMDKEARDLKEMDKEAP